MKTIEVIEATQRYLDYLKRHLENVNKAWKVIQDKCSDMPFIYDDYVWSIIDGMVQIHDLSKLSEEEFVQYRRRFYPCDDGLTDEEIKQSVSHHHDHNTHHWENLARREYDQTGINYSGVPNCVCMVIDWMAMGYEFGDSAQQYYESHKEVIKLPEWAVTFIYEIFERVADVEAQLNSFRRLRGLLESTTLDSMGGKPDLFCPGGFKDWESYWDEITKILTLGTK